ncbi:Tyrosine--tRNA ligase [Morus notabilis]|uniref:tyrosine--tRNA ligase n=1 Tax=Morus notabilis TaxID=981085 RepID=W9QXK3_9ROSA|nr:Tyrosine--tRNA ligase [Morus notabilis]
MATDAPDQIPVEGLESVSISNSQSKEEPSSSSNEVNQLSLEERYQIVRSVGEECIQEDELRNLLAKKPEPVCYDGFEPSGRMHIAQFHQALFHLSIFKLVDGYGMYFCNMIMSLFDIAFGGPKSPLRITQGVLKTISVNKLTSAGCRVKIWIADWFAQLNNKMGGDLKKIETVGRYLIEIWKAVGMDQEGGKVEFLWSSKEINARAHEYWPLVMDIARRNKLPRIIRCSQIMGRNEQDELTAAQILYPCMQCADIFFLKADICQLGMDQRKVNVLAREYCDDIKRKNKPIILSHHMLPGLQQGQEKMSKSDPSSSIFMEDDEAEVNLKIKKAFCPPKIVEGNPCLEYIKYLVFPWFNEFIVERSANNGGDKVFKSFEELVVDYEDEKLHPADLKPALSKALNKILEPVREHFKKDSNAKELLKRVKSHQVIDDDEVWRFLFFPFHFIHRLDKRV